ncbi:Protoglobin-domain-containing protein [Collybia nuda]|uniref:Protoglobin-domain-containing protein n=1 Tax=Collybia nuda TaxID=64659 RepID=A0A9P5XWE0_9AGAR|nr:Protoglobin-domain-containing protein [Collybia nuda]
MQHIDPESLNDLPSRIDYLRKFIEFTSDDAAALHAAKPLVAPLVPVVVDAVYTKLLSFDITSKAFTPEQTGQEKAAAANVSDLSHSHPQVKFRKDFLTRYLVQLVTLDYEKPQSWEYLNKVGLMHTGAIGFAHRAKKPALRVEYIHCAILLGYVQDILINAVTTHPDLDTTTKNTVLRAVNKVLWIQNDLFARHYMAAEEAQTEDKISVKKSTASLVAGGLLALGAGLFHFVL